MRYILSWDYYNKVKNCLDDIDENEEEIRQLADDEDFDEDRKYFGLLIEDSRKELLEIFEEYCESNRKHETFECTLTASSLKQITAKLKKILSAEDSLRIYSFNDNISITDIGQMPRLTELELSGYISI